MHICQTIEFLQKDFEEMYSSLKQRQYIDTITSQKLGPKKGKKNCFYIYIQDWSTIIISRINYTNFFYIYIQDWSTIIISRINYRINLILRTAHADTPSQVGA